MQVGFLEIKWTDILDLTLVAFLMYYIYKLVRGSVASRVFLGYLLIYLFYLIVKAIGLELLTRILEYFMGVGAIALIVLFQQEIRRFLLLVGKSTSLTNTQFFANLLGTDVIPDEKYPLKTIIEASKTMSSEFTGGIIVIHGKDKSDLQLTSDDKKAIQDTMDEFVTEVSEIVDFNKLNLYPNNVEWSGKVTELDVEFFYSIGETNGIYINGTMTKIDDDYLEFLNKLKQYYEKFKSKWSKVIAARKKTPEA